MSWAMPMAIRQETENRLDGGNRSCRSVGFHYGIASVLPRQYITPS
jgi:hypothetical protein